MTDSQRETVRRDVEIRVNRANSQKDNSHRSGKTIRHDISTSKMYLYLPKYKPVGNKPVSDRGSEGYIHRKPLQSLNHRRRKPPHSEVREGSVA